MRPNQRDAGKFFGLWGKTVLRDAEDKRESPDGQVYYAMVIIEDVNITAITDESIEPNSEQDAALVGEYVAGTTIQGKIKDVTIAAGGGRVILYKERKTKRP